MAKHTVKRIVIGPKLGALMYARTVRVDGGVYLARAADGIEVQIGCTGQEQQIENYLESHPTPDTW